jgi:hypothetical protein
MAVTVLITELPRQKVWVAKPYDARSLRAQEQGALVGNFSGPREVQLMIRGSREELDALDIPGHGGVRITPITLKLLESLMAARLVTREWVDKLQVQCERSKPSGSKTDRNS